MLYLVSGKRKKDDSEAIGIMKFVKSAVNFLVHQFFKLLMGKLETIVEY